jgi:NifU-like protein
MHSSLRYYTIGKGISRERPDDNLTNLWQNLAVRIYPESIAKKARSPKFVGRCPGENAEGRAASFVCGSSIRFSVSIDTTTKQIQQLRYETNGCGYVIAAAEELIERIEGRKLTDLSGSTDILASTIEEREHCVAAVADAFRSALADHRRKTIEEFAGEMALICTCFGVSEETIVHAIKEKNTVSVAAVSAACNAGSGCGSCQMLIQELIDSLGDDR